MLKRLTSLGLLCMLAIASYAQHLNEILSELSAPAKQSVLVVSHRGDWRNAPENSLQAFQNCLIREKVVTFRMVKLNLLLSIFLITK